MNDDVGHRARTDNHGQIGSTHTHGKVMEAVVFLGVTASHRCNEVTTFFEHPGDIAAHTDLVARDIDHQLVTFPCLALVDEGALSYRKLTDRTRTASNRYL